MSRVRQVFMVLSPRSLSYARDALESLFRNSLHTLHLRLVTNSKQDNEQLSEAVADLDARTHQWTVFAGEELTRGRRRCLGHTTTCAHFAVGTLAGER
jgi:hypothetical protein